MLTIPYCNADVARALIMVTDMWNSLDSAYNSQMYSYYLNVCATLIHVLSTCQDRERHVPVDAESLRDAVAFVVKQSSNIMLPPDIQNNFKLIQKLMYRCCGYGKVKFNGRRTDS